MSKNIKVYRNKNQGVKVDYSSMIGKVFKIFKETSSTYVLHSSTEYSFVTTVPKKDCKITDEPTVEYKWSK